MVDFLVIGPQNVITYKEIFPLIKDGDISLGWNIVVEFDGTDKKFGNIRWFSSISDYCPPRLMLSKKYVEGYYKKFDNYDAINIYRIDDIPGDYDDVMGVSTSFIDKYNSEQFEIVGLLTDNKGDGIYVFNGTETYTDERHKRSRCGVMDGKRMFNRLLIRRKKDG